MEEIKYCVWANNPKYEVASDGTIFSLNYQGSGKRKALAPVKRPDGYWVIQLHKNGKVKRELIHRMLAICFLPNPHNYPVINHKDGNPSNNALDNLEWCTQRDNIIHGFEVLGRTIPQHQREINRLANRGNKNLNNKLTSEQVLEIIEKRKQKIPAKIVAAEYGISHNTVYGIQYQTWRWGYIRQNTNNE
jgi:hypothetical protein